MNLVTPQRTPRRSRSRSLPILRRHRNDSRPRYSPASLPEVLDYDHGPRTPEPSRDLKSDKYDSKRFSERKQPEPSYSQDHRKGRDRSEGRYRRKETDTEVDLSQRQRMQTEREKEADRVNKENAVLKSEIEALKKQAEGQVPAADPPSVSFDELLEQLSPTRQNKRQGATLENFCAPSIKALVSSLKLQPQQAAASKEDITKLTRAFDLLDEHAKAQALADAKIMAQRYGVPADKFQRTQVGMKSLIQIIASLHAVAL